MSELALTGLFLAAAARSTFSCVLFWCSLFRGAFASWSLLRFITHRNLLKGHELPAQHHVETDGYNVFSIASIICALAYTAA